MIITSKNTERLTEEPGEVHVLVLGYVGLVEHPVSTDFVQRVTLEQVEQRRTVPVTLLLHRVVHPLLCTETERVQ